jgi:hypothetical protein
MRGLERDASGDINEGRTVMGAAATTVQIRHSQMVHSVETCQSQDARPQELTLLELVLAVCDTTNDEREVVATVVHMLRTGRVRLCGNFSGEPIEHMMAS